MCSSFGLRLVRIQRNQVSFFFVGRIDLYLVSRKDHDNMENFLGCTGGANDVRGCSCCCYLRGRRGFIRSKDKAVTENGTRL